MVRSFRGNGSSNPPPATNFNISIMSRKLTDKEIFRVLKLEEDFLKEIYKTLTTQDQVLVRILLNEHTCQSIVTRLKDETNCWFSWGEGDGYIVVQFYTEKDARYFLGRLMNLRPEYSFTLSELDQQWRWSITASRK